MLPPDAARDLLLEGGDSIGIPVRSCSPAFTYRRRSRILVAKPYFELDTYSALTWTGMLAFGRDVWLRHGEVFSLVFGTFARFAPADANEGRLLLRPFGAGLSWLLSAHRSDHSRSTVAGF